ncbi:MAG TPA: hypothetical protein VIR57_19125 [Chloroflexota bacterium]
MSEYPIIPPPHGFGMVRLKLLLALTRSPELDTPHWHGQFHAEIGAQGQVKAAAHQALGEVRLEEGE